MQTHTNRVLDFLSDAASYPHHPSKVTMVQTHASWVFLAPPFVYKIKKPVDFGFLNFSTLELRHADCECEVTLNRRLADDIYLGVEAICEHMGSLRFGEDGEVLEWAVKMRQLDEKFFLSHLLDRGSAGPADMDRIVERLLDFYTFQQRPPASECTTATERLRLSTDGNFTVAHDFIGRCLSRQAFDAMALFTSEYYVRHKALLQSRIDGGWIRDCHGDLHAEHIHLAPDAVRIYDCIEFNTRFRYIDVASDIAFLAMDLDFHGRHDLGTYLADRMSSLLKDKAAGGLMDFYKCYRACVRGKVESLHSIAESAGDEERNESLRLARRYFQLALNYAIGGSKPMVLILMGRVASGKSTLARALSDETGWQVESSDIVRKSLAGVPAHYRGCAEERAALYAPEMTQRAYSALVAAAVESLLQGRSMILDATFSRRVQREALQTVMKSRGFRVLWIEARGSNDAIMRRLAKRESAGDVVSDARLGDLENLSAAYEPPDELEPADKICIATDNYVAHALHELMKELVMRHASHEICRDIAAGTI